MEAKKILFKSGKFIVILIVLLIIVLGYHSGIFQRIAEAVQVTIDADVYINGTGHLQSGSQTVFIDDLTGYKFFRDGPGYCVYKKTTDRGATWSSTTTVDAQTDCIQIQVWYDKWTPGSASSSIHIATLDTSASDVFYNRLDPGPDTLLMGTAPVTTTLAQGGTIVEGANTVSIARATNGTIYIGSIDNSDSYVMRCTGSCSVSTNWTEAGATNTPFMLSNNYGMLLPLTGGNMLALQRDITAEDMTSKVWNNAGSSWDAATTTFDISATDNTTYDVGMATMVSSTTPGTVYLAYIASSTLLGTDDEIRTAKYSGGSWSTTGKLLTGSSTLGITNVALGLDAANDNVYVAYSGQTTAGTAGSGNVWWKWATSSMTNWSGPIGPLLSFPDDIYGVDINGISDQRIYASWFVNTGDDIIADTLADIAPGIIASSTGTHASYMAASTTNNYVGGAFVLTENYKSHDVTGITITETGTIDASVYVKNIKLKYEMDSTYPYDCASESYGGSETQFGSTDTDGFSNANGTSSFSGSTITVSTTSAMCVYTVLDLLDSPIATSTLKITISNATTDVVVSGGVAAAPSASQSMASTTAVYTNALTQIHYHWRLDDGTETNAQSATAGIEDIALTNVAQTFPYRVRLEVSNKGGTTTGPYQYRLEYAQKSTTCSAVSSWTDVGAALGDWDMDSVSQLTDGSDTTNIASTTGGVTDDRTSFLTPNGGQKELTSQTGNITLAVSQYVELEYGIRATASSTKGATYCFRVTNTGTPIPAYTVYPEATIKFPTDFQVQRGVMTITGTSTTLVAGVDYVAPNASTSAFIRITNTHYTGAGSSAATANQNSVDVTAYIQNPSNIRTSVTFARPNGVSDTRVAWEIVEYTGVSGGENEIIVREQTAITYGATALSATTSVIAGIVTDADIVVFITGQYNPDIGRTNYNAGLSTSLWNAAPNTASFWRGEGTGAVITSYAVVEFTGSNWVIQRTNDHPYTAAGVTETENIIAVGSITRTFLHAQKRVGLNLDTHANFGHEVVLSGINQVSFRLDPAATTPGQHWSVAWVIENTQTVGDSMVVSRSNGTSTGGVAPLTTIVNHGTTVDDLSVSSIFINNRASDALRTFPEPMLAVRMISKSQYEIWMSNTGGNRVFFTEIVEWPTARRKITQKDYRIFVNNGAILPTDPWPPGVTDLGENAEVTGLDNPIATGGSVRIRMNLTITVGAMIPGIDSFKLQFAPRSTPSCTAISSTAWLSIGNIGSTTALWRASSTPVADGTALSTDPPVVGDLKLINSDVAGTFEEENNTAVTPYLVEPAKDVEYDWAIEDNGAADKTSYCFRMVESDGTLLTGYNAHPTIRTIGYGAQSQDWQWFDDAENTNPTTTLAATNTAPIDIDFNNAIKLELTLREVNGAPKNNTKFRLQFSESASFSTSTFVAASSSCSDLSYWCYTDGGGTDNATITAKRMGDADTCTGGVGNGCGTHNEFGTTTSSFVHKAGAATEFSFTIRSSGARVNRVYYFRAYDAANDEDVPLGSGKVYPSLVTKGASLVFTMSGIATSTSVEGVVTDFATTPTMIPFGSLVASTSIVGVQRLTVDTNGTQGHRILMMLTGDMQTSNGAVMTNVTGTNAAPVAWNTGCVSSATSCFGYHAGDDTLQGGSTRFSANDTYSGFSTTTPEEVSYISQPVIGDTTDIVFKLMRRNLQSAGQYTASVMYISIPMF